MKLLFRIVLFVTLLPPALCAPGFILSSVFGCTGTFHLETCATPGTYRFVAPLLVMGWVSFFVVPVGAVLLIAIAAVRWWLSRSKHFGEPGRP